MTDRLKIMISGGGTGGHIFPAISIANEIKSKVPHCDILFVGAENRMEMDRVPAAGYKIEGLPVVGFPRKPSLKMFTFVFKLWKSMSRARKIVTQFNPHVVVGVGGYASGPVLRMASKLNIPTLIQEQNSYAGITNRILAKKASKICVAYDNMSRYFPANKIVLTGNPVRKDLLESNNKTDEAFSFYNLQPGKKVLLVVGGSLGARTINSSILRNIDMLLKSNIQVIWQTGSFYFDSVIESTKNIDLSNIHIHKFISRMGLAYAVSDLVVSRAGAGTISEICLMQKPSILVPSPNVAEDHQTKNAMALVNKNAAVMVSDAQAPDELVKTALELIFDEKHLSALSENANLLAKPNAASDIADLILQMKKINA